MVRDMLRVGGALKNTISKGVKMWYGSRGECHKKGDLTWKELKLLFS